MFSQEFVRPAARYIPLILTALNDFSAVKQRLTGAPWSAPASGEEPLRSDIIIAASIESFAAVYACDG
jgi:hypothetical protein